MKVRLCTDGSIQINVDDTVIRDEVNQLGVPFWIYA